MQPATRLLRATLVVVWLALLAKLWWQAPAAAPPPAPWHGEPAGLGVPTGDEAWMGLYMQDRKIGYTHQRLARDGDGYRFEQESLLRLTVLGQPQTVSAVAWGRTDADFALRSFAMSLHSGVGSLEAEGSVAQRELQISVHTGTETTQERVPMTEPLYLPANARLFVARSGLTGGRSVSVQVFDPIAMSSHPLRVTVIDREAIEVSGQPLDLWRVREEYHGVESMLWMDDAGRVLEERGPMGMTALRESAEQAVGDIWEAGEGLDLARAVAIPVDRRIDQARTVRRLALRVEGIDADRIPSDQRQTFADGVLTVRRERGAPIESFTLPYLGREHLSDLERTPFLQVDHPRVIATATQVVAGEADARRAAERLRAWVFHRLRKVPTASIPNALQVLDMNEGDCNEHAVLFAALGRAVGLPSRIVAGAVYLDGAFLYHAWNEVWLGSGWVSVDAALNQMPVDATHIKLLEGGPDVHAALLPLIGNLKIAVVAAN